MPPEAKARKNIDKMLATSGWVVQDMKELNPRASLGVAVREFQTDSGPVDYALFVDSVPVGILEAKPENEGQNMTDIEYQSSRYANSKLKYVKVDYKIRFVYESTGTITNFTDYKDINYRTRPVFSVHRPETLKNLLLQNNTVRNNLKTMPQPDTTGFRECQVKAISGLDVSFAENRPKALIQMATGAGKTFTAISEVYRLLKFSGMKRILFLVDTKSLGEQAEQEFRAYKPNDDPNRSFAELYGVQRLKTSFIPEDVQVCVSTIQRMYSILKGEELDESAEDVSAWETNEAGDVTKTVSYNEKYPPEFFDCIIVDECHRSIYNVWSQVLEYFDAFIIGLTATPAKRTIAFFHENIVSEYTRKQAIIDGVNVGEDVYLIETVIGKSGASIKEAVVEKRERLTRKQRWEQLDEEINYVPASLDKEIVNPSQIRTVIKAFKDSLPVLFPNRKEIPKTLVFAKNDSHAEDIVKIIREEFGMGNNFCQKITCKSEKPSELLAQFRIEYNPRIAVTVDMIATGTDVKPIECLLFMRDVRSANYFEQMVGRGTRTISKDALQKVSPSAAEGKDHFVIIDAVGVTKSLKIETPSVDYKKSVTLKELMLNIVTGSTDEETLCAAATRIARLNNRLDKTEKKEFEKNIGLSAQKLAQNLFDAFDTDVILQKAEKNDISELTDEQYETIQQELIAKAVEPFFKPEARDYIENVRRTHYQVIDNENLDTVLFAGFDKEQQGNADMVIANFKEFIEENRNELIALRIIYDQRYADRAMAIEKLKELYQKMQTRRITVERLWECYAIKYPEKVKRGTMAQLADLISIIRFELGYADELKPFADRVNYNFMKWTMKCNEGNVHFTEEQMKWLRMIRDHIISSLSIELQDFDRSPFDAEGGLMKYYDLFGEQYYEAVLLSLNSELVA